MSNESTTVLVTGASGFIALECVRQLLERGYIVRGTLRTTAREAHLRQVLARHVEINDRLSFFSADLSSDEGWEEAAAGCDYVLHVASPLPSSIPQNEDEVIVPAREGTLRVLSAAAKAGVKRVVLTSSVAAVFHGLPAREGSFDENDWTDTSADIGAYAKSKTLAERAAWDFVGSLPSDRPLELVTILPGVVLGPILDGDRQPSTSTKLVQRLLKGNIPGSARVNYVIVDVRDVAWAHLAAMTNPAAAGKRFCCFSDNLWLGEIAAILHAHFAERGYKVPTRVLPDFLVRLVALVDKNVRLLTGRLGQPLNLSNERIKQVLAWQPHTAEEMIVATAESLIEHGLI